MKKTFYLLLAVSFVLGLGLMTATNAQEQERERNANAIDEVEGLEKIHSPEDIKDFRIMKNVNGALFGVRIATTTGNGIVITPTGTSTLEKISHPALINLYEKIRRIGNALWGYKKPEARDDANFTVAPEISACVNAAIDVKDKALMARITAAAVELNAAITVRSTCQQTAVVATSTPRASLNACVKTFQDARKAIQETSKKTQETTWNTYKESLKACRASSTAAVPMIEDGGNIFE